MAKPRKTKTTKLAHDRTLFAFASYRPKADSPEQWPTYRPTDNMTAAIMQHRASAGLKVTMPDTGWIGYFATMASRDEFVARARAKGRPVQIG